MQVELAPPTAIPEALHPPASMPFSTASIPIFPYRNPLTQRGAQFDESYSQARLLLPRLSIFFWHHRGIAGRHWPVWHSSPIAFARRTSEIGIRMALGAQARASAVVDFAVKSLLVSGAAILAGVPVAIAGGTPQCAPCLFGVPGPAI